MMSLMLLRPRSVDICCDVDIAQTPESFHAHAIPDGIQIRPGDEVIVHGVPTQIRFGQCLSCQCKATVRRAGLIKRAWTEFAGLFALTELYDVGFEPKEVP